MKKIFFIGCVLIGFSVRAQLNFEVQVGGSNFIGYSLSTEPITFLDSAEKHGIGIEVGLGLSIHQQSMIVQSGLHYYYKNWGIGGEISGFTPVPFSAVDRSAIDLAFIFYPNVNYTFPFKKGDYLKVSAGVLMAYGRGLRDDRPAIVWQGDLIPGIGVSYGIKYKRK